MQPSSIVCPSKAHLFTTLLISWRSFSVISTWWPRRPISSPAAASTDALQPHNYISKYMLLSKAHPPVDDLVDLLAQLFGDLSLLGLHHLAHHAHDVLPALRDAEEGVGVSWCECSACRAAASHPCCLPPLKNTCLGGQRRECSWEVRTCNVNDVRQGF